jgi:tetratricopeptide (TPR) repeat protein
MVLIRRSIKFLLLTAIITFSVRAYTQNNLKAETYYYSGVENLNVKSAPDLAIKDFEKAIKLNPDYAEAYYFRGMAYNKLSNYSKAIIDFSKAIEINPKYFEAYMERADLKMNIFEDKRGAEEDLKKAVALRPELPDPYEKLGYLKYQQKIYYEAISYYNKCIDRDSANVDYYILRADAKVKQGLLDDATYDYDKAISMDKNAIVPHFKKGKMLYECGRYSDAVLEFNLIIELEETLYPGNFFPDPYYYKGMAKFRMHDVQGACENWNLLKQMLDQRFMKFENTDEMIRQNCANAH